MSAIALLLCLLVAGVTCDEEARSAVLRVLVKLRTRTRLSDDDLAVLANAEEDDLPERVKRVVKVIASGTHVCCSSVPTSVVKKSRSAKRVTTHKTTYRAGSSHCGFWGWGRCARYESRTRDIVTYVTEYYQDTVQAKCPEQHVVCCHMYVNVSGKCVHLNDLSQASGHLVG